MNNDFLRREWGAVSFLVVTALGIVVVPVGLSLNRHTVYTPPESLVGSSPSPLPSPQPSPSSGPVASPSAAPASPVASPTPAGTESPSPSAAPSALPSPSPS
ncbi:MAG: hypothetical protein ACYDGR_11140 [Candidatus Dormibacteria bacterium]